MIFIYETDFIAILQSAVVQGEFAIESLINKLHGLVRRGDLVLLCCVHLQNCRSVQDCRVRENDQSREERAQN